MEVRSPRQPYSWPAALPLPDGTTPMARSIHNPATNPCPSKGINRNKLRQHKYGHQSRWKTFSGSLFQISLLVVLRQLRIVLKWMRCLMTELFGRVVKKKFVNSESNSLRWVKYLSAHARIGDCKGKDGRNVAAATNTTEWTEWEN